MTVSSTSNRVSYTGNGVTTAFSFPYRFLANADLVVYENEVLQVITTDYAVTGAGDDAGGLVTFVAAPANGLEIVILRDPALTQGLDLVENDSLPAESVEDAFDKLTMIAQRLDDRMDRAFVLSDAAIAAADLTIPVPVANEVLIWNATADALTSSAIADIGAVIIPVPIASGGTGSTSAATARTALGLDTVIRHDAQSTLTAGYMATPYNAGTKSSGTFTPDHANGNQQYCTNGGAFTLAPPTNATSIILEVLNNGSAGAVTTSGFTKVTGAFTTTNGDKFACNILKTQSYSLLQIQALQ